MAYVAALCLGCLLLAGIAVRLIWRHETGSEGQKPNLPDSSDGKPSMLDVDTIPRRRAILPTSRAAERNFGF